MLTRHRLPHAVSALLVMSAVVTGRASAQWTVSGVPVCRQPAEQVQPWIVSDTDSTVFIVWSDYRSGYTDIYAQRLRLDGTVCPGWPENGRILCGAPLSQDSPVAISDGAGGVFVAWVDGRPGTPGSYATRVLPSGDAAPGWPADGLRLSATNVVGSVRMLSDDAGGAIIVWSQFLGSSNSVGVCAQRVTASGALSAGWPAGGFVVSDDIQSQSNPQLVSDGAHGALVVWRDDRSDPQGDLYAQHVTAGASIATGWPQNGVPVCNVLGGVSSFDVTSDAAGGAYVAWMDERNVADEYAMRIGPSGAPAPGWATNGIRMSFTNNAWNFEEGPEPHLVTLPAGGIVMIWEDWTAGSSWQVLAGRLTATGATPLSWPAGGLQVSESFYRFLAPATIVPDGAGGVYAVWPSATSVMAQRILADGTLPPGWFDGGVVLSPLGPAGQTVATRTSDGSCIAAWVDQRWGNSDIVAQRVTSAGAVSATVSVSEYKLGRGIQASATPNPGRGGTWIHYSSSGTGPVRITVFDTRGRIVTDVQQGTVGPGRHSVFWDARDGGRSPVRSGVYFVRVRSDEGVSEFKAVLLR